MRDGSIGIIAGTLIGVWCMYASTQILDFDPLDAAIGIVMGVVIAVFLGEKARNV